MAVSQSLTLTQISQDVTNNTSQVRILWTSRQTGESHNYYAHDGKYYVSINGGAEVERRVSYILPKAETETILDTTITVQHNVDGTCTVAVRTWMDTRISAGEVTQNKTLTLDTIPRATVPTVSNNNVSMGSLIRINTPRASSSFTHDLAYRFGSGEYVNIATGVGTYHDWTTPDLSTQIPNNTEGTVTIRCITKSGSTAIGTKTVTMILRVPTSAAYLPTITNVSVTEATEGLAAQFGAYIKGKSTLKVTITASGAKGSTIKTYHSTVAGNAYSEKTFTTPVLSTAGTRSLLVTVGDSRGRTANATVSIPVLDYEPPAVTKMQVYRVNDTGAPDPEGEYIAVQYGYHVAALNNKNTANMVVQYKSSDSETWATLFTGSALSADAVEMPTSLAFSTDYQFDVRITVTDWFGASASYPATLPSGAVILDFAANGKGLGIGTTAQEDGLQVAWPAKMAGGFTPIPLAEGLDLNTLLIPNSYGGKAYNGYINCPDTSRDFTLEVLPAGADGQLMQRLTTCVPLAPVTYTRFYVSSAWQEWAITGFESIWQAATLSSRFSLYDSAVSVQYRRSGGMVEIKGVVKPVSKITNADGWVTITTLPAGYVPGGQNEVHCVCQGGGASLWLLRITTGGAVQFGRYQLGGEYVDADTSARLPFSVTFLANR